MALSFLQANVNHSARAQDLLFQSMTEWLIHVVVVAEPYYVPSSDDWVEDRNGIVAITTRTAVGSPAFEHVVRGQGYISARVRDVTVIGVYFSPNRTLAEFETFLVELGTLIGQNRSDRIMVVGDFNAKSTAWGSPTTDPRGEELEEWTVSIGLFIINQGSAHTCVRHNGGSIVDLTLVDAALVSRVRNWQVLIDEETLSDHRYVRFEVSTSPTSANRQALREYGPRWSLKRINKEVFYEAALVQAWVTGSDMLGTVEQEAVGFGEAMSRVCNAAMPRVGPCPPKGAVYWWSMEIAQLRRSCVTRRRQYQRSRRRRTRHEQEELHLYASYREAVESLQVAIRIAKDLAQEEMLQSLNADPWGRPYKMVRNKLRPWAPPITQTLQPQQLEAVVGSLFPRGLPRMRPHIGVEVASVYGVPAVTEGELRAAMLRLRAKNTAPGPDGVHGLTLALALGPLEPRLRRLYNACLLRGQFPHRWKTGKLVLLRKEGRPAESPSTYRPIVLLDEVGKLFERVVAARIVRHLEETGPDLSEHQFGFRRGRSTIDAIARVRALADDAVSQGKVVLAVSLDIANAFNSLPWDSIEGALEFHAIPDYLRRVVVAYLSDRAIIYPAHDGEWLRREMSCGVPQGSVLGPLLWNIGYDWVLRGTTLQGVDVTCYADDTLVTASGRDFKEARVLATAGVAQVVTRIRQLGLEVALHKSEALCFHGPRKAPPAGENLVVGGASIAIKSTMKYLGLVLDSRWKFEEHFRRLAPKLIATAGVLGRLLPNLGGPGVGCRQIYLGVVRSMALYGAPIWADDLNTRSRTLLRKPQRVIAIRVIRGYRTISFEAACALAGTPPWDLDAEVMAEMHQRRVDARLRGEHPSSAEITGWRRIAQVKLLHVWQRRLESPSAGHLTVEMIRPVLKHWVERSHGVLTFRLVQVLSGHGCFGRYLYRIAGRERSAECHECSSTVDTAQHTLADCPAWAEHREVLVATVGQDLSLPAVVKAMVVSDSSWIAVDAFCEKVMSQKEEAERLREDNVGSDPVRRRRVGRRRAAHDRRLPP